MKKKLLILFLFVFVLARQPLWVQDEWARSFQKVFTMLNLIEDHYYQDVDYNELAYSSVKGMLPTLDPHSYLLEPQNFATVREDYKGKYFGLGILIQKYGDLLMVVAPLEGAPAYRLGIMPGDVISHIEGESTQPITNFQAMQKLRGPKGTEVTITIVREGLDEPFDLTITRAEIPLHSVPYAFMLNEDIGYIYIRNFSETTTREFEEKMELLKGQGMRKLILDFRYNGGGTFNQSFEISDEFLPKDTPVVSIKGRRQYYNREFRASKNGQYEDIPLVILIDQGTASAPEIVSGAVKDNDRGLIVGEKSFGKGLVQTLFRLKEDVYLALTTSKYYTPSGRSIQRDYTRLEDWVLGREKPEEDREVTYTAQGRKVLGQGGIAPDYEIKSPFDPIFFDIWRSSAFFNYARKFADQKTALSRQILSGKGIDQSFRVDAAVMADFKRHLKDMDFTYEAADFDRALGQIKRELERQIFAALWGVEAGEKVFRLNDPVVQKAIEVFPEAEKLLRGF